MKSKQVNQTALSVLNEHRYDITRQEFKTLRGQILAGEDEAAMKGLSKALRRRIRENEQPEPMLSVQ